MTAEELHELHETALRVREHVIRLSGQGGCFIGASLSCADLLVYLYRKFLHLRARYPQIWQSVDWDREFPRTDIQVKVDFAIGRTGTYR